MSDHAETRIALTLLAPPLGVKTPDGETMMLVIPGYDEMIAAMQRVRRNYAALHSLPIWEVSARVFADPERPNVLHIIAHHEQTIGHAFALAAARSIDEEFVG